MRANYIHWIEDILQLHSPESENLEDMNAMLPIVYNKRTNSEIHGIDIGTGANLIFPLLGVSMNNWNWIASDINPQALDIASQIINMNALNDKIALKLVNANEPPISSIIYHSDNTGAITNASTEYFDFCMCNPPFYNSVDEAISNPQSCSSGSYNELVTSGGEIEFISRMVRDSVTLQTRVKFYTSMVGKKASLKPLIRLLHEVHVTNIMTTEFTQGKTSRWGICWSFTSAGLDVPLVQKSVFAAAKENKRRNVEIWDVSLSGTSFNT